MHIIVCIKQVIDTSARIRIVDGKVDAQGSSRVVNPYDEFALEEAIRIRESDPASGTQVTAISLGPESFKDALKTALAMGVDRAIHLEDPAFEGLDNLGVAHVLALVIKSLPYDLILCGRQAVDDDMAQVGPSLAVLLGLPFATVVTGLKLSEDKNKAEITRQIEGGNEVLESALPLLVTCQKGLNIPRLPSLKGIMAAKKKPVEILTAQDLMFRTETMGISRNRVEGIGLSLPPERKKGQILHGPLNESVATLVSRLKEDRVI
ncbi:MAG: electron transfer flavoprotein subunit beta/FixA family protein [Nitrospinaceae bacterium]|nr:MAG: electron transfer flavoprotein subunit beta/FixA family protein [Nitrospinaceae bacterium]